MEYTYEQSSGRMSLGTLFVEVGYSGRGAGRNNPDMQDVQNIGPIPQGGYTIGQAYLHPHLGPITMDLTPDPENEMFGRSLFRIHGDNAIHDASQGCIEMSHNARIKISISGIVRLRVIA